MTNLPPPLVSFDLYHRAMRTDAAELRDRLCGSLDAGSLAAVATWFDHYRRALLIHAAAEDGVMWPALLDVRPDAKPIVEGMDEEHAALDTLLGDLAGALGAGPARIEEARRFAGDLVDLVGRHLDGEEANAVPILLEAMTVPEIGDLIGRVQRHSGPEGPSIAIPFFLFHATDAERDAVLGAVPPPIREGYERGWREQYASLHAAVER